jgi:curli biogenesis system outer membrane secretion channel CsgG
MKTRILLAVALLGVFLATTAYGWGESAPEVDNSTTTQKLQSLPRKAGPRKGVTIYEFRSTVQEVSAEMAADMFATALIKSGAFRVLERQRLSEGVMRERQLNAQGMTSGEVANRQLQAADYIFEGAVTEANAQESGTGIGAAFRGLGLGSNTQKAQIGLDLRVISAATGEVLDSVNVRKKVDESGISVSGIGQFVQSISSKDLHGADLDVAHGRKEGVDKALRECIEEAVYQLVNRYGA